MNESFFENTLVTLTLDERLDKALAAALEGFSRTRLSQLIKEGHVKRLEPSPLIVTNPAFAAQKGDLYRLTLPKARAAAPQAEAIALEIVYEDDDLLVVNKQAGLVVHPAAGHWEGTLVNALLAHCGPTLSGIGGVARPGIVHRLDKDTSGLMVVAKNDFAHKALSEQFSSRTLSRLYRAIVWGVPSPLEGRIEGAIGRHPRARQKMSVRAHGGKEALTFYKTCEVFAPFAALVSCKLASGRTHQIRVHMAHQGHPVVGDSLYATRKTASKKGGVIAELTYFPRQALHAGELAFIHPRTQKPLVFKVPDPEDFDSLLKYLRNLPL
ncbi:MAG: RluA family pseudouridine synthase [Alphaproteobacteria bacterium]|nr:RluA family pseudouridine synthase [Alphaproteobacteria bacterium]